MPSLGLFYMFFSKKIMGFNIYAPTQSYQDNYTIFLVTLTFSLLLPTIFVFILKKKGEIKSYHMEHKEERLLPFSFIAVCMICAFYLLFFYFDVQVQPLVKVFYAGCIISIVFSLFITLSWKISVHMVGVGGFTGALFLLNYTSESDMLPALCAAFVISGVVAYSRLTLKAHSLKQVVAGFALGFVSETFLLILY